MKEKLKAIFLSDWTTSEKCLLLADVLLLGVLLGWLTSPLKNGFRILSGNTWDFSHNDYWEEEEMEEEE